MSIMTDRPHPLDVVAPARIALLIEDVALTKVRLPFVKTLTLGVLAGAFIAFGAMFFTATITGSELGYGPTRLLGGMAFSLGLVLVIVGGAELFTGNSLIVIAAAARRVTLREMLRNWAIVYAGNMIGALGAAVLVHLSGVLEANGGEVGQTAVSIAQGKLALDPLAAFARAILCNVLVCLAVWMCFAAHSVSGKVLVILFPITAFVALGFEHSVANMYMIPLALLHCGDPVIVPFLTNLAIVTAGNVIGGGMLVALVYWLVYLRKGTPA